MLPGWVSRSLSSGRYAEKMFYSRERLQGHPLTGLLFFTKEDLENFELLLELNFSIFKLSSYIFVHVALAHLGQDLVGFDLVTQQIFPLLQWNRVKLMISTIDKSQHRFLI